MSLKGSDVSWQFLSGLVPVDDEMDLAYKNILMLIYKFGGVFQTASKNKVSP